MAVDKGTLGLGTDLTVGANEVLAGIGKTDTASYEPTSPGELTAVDNRRLPIPASPGYSKLDCSRVFRTWQFLDRMSRTSLPDDRIVKIAVEIMQRPNALR